MRPSTSLTARLVAVLAVLGLVLTACGGGSSSSKDDGDSGYDYASLTGTLNGSGATFPKAFYEEAIAGFSQVASDVTVNYNAVGSGQGKKDLAAATSDWAGTDSLVSDADKATFKGPFLYFPTVAAPITVSYTLAGVTKLNLSPATLGKIFSGKVTIWNDAAIAADNPGVTLPNTGITVVVRSDGSGTTSNFSKYLAAAAPEAFTLTPGDTVSWPGFQAGKGNTGVAQLVKATNGAIGYVDYSDAKASNLTFASIGNKDGKFVQPSLEGASAALAGATINPDLTYSALNAPGADAYPITAGTYIIVYSTISDAKKAAAIRGWLNYVLTSGQSLAPDADFAPLPTTLRDRAIAQIASIKG
ncbi:MAG: phosphate ABC transporter substrate-binding protein PstS [Acidobacteria bacterium]|nr:phosphate ABC transporter substrate-binding protein PstS [Acidobacteriota bacterium]